MEWAWEMERFSLMCPFPCYHAAPSLMLPPQRAMSHWNMMKFRHGKYKEGVYKIGDYDEEVGEMGSWVGFAVPECSYKPASRSSAS